MPWVVDDEEEPIRPEDDYRPNFENRGPSWRDALGRKPPRGEPGRGGWVVEDIAPRELEVRRAPGEYGGAVAYGLREGGAFLPGMADLVAQGADLISPYDPESDMWTFQDPATGAGLADRYREATEGMVEPGFEPTGELENLIAGGTEAATTYAVPGGFGFKSVRALPAARRGGRAYVQAGKEGMAANSARLAAANAGAVAGGRTMQEMFPNNPNAEIAGAILGGGGLDSAINRAMAAPIRSARSGAARKVKGAQAENPLQKLMTGLSRRIGAGISEGEFTDTDVLRYRDDLMRVLTGRAERLTDNDVLTVRRAQGDEMGDALQRAKNFQDRIFDELKLYADMQYRDGLLPPSLYGILKNENLATTDLYDRSMRLSRGQPGVDVRTRNEAAVRQTIEDIEALRPEGATGSPYTVADAAYAAEREADLIASGPYRKPKYEPSRMREILMGAGEADPLDLAVSVDGINRVLKNAAGDVEITEATRGALEPIDDMIRDWRNKDIYDANGNVPVWEYDGLRQALQDAASSSDSGLVKNYVGAISKRLDRQIERRLRRVDSNLYNEYRSNRTTYAEFRSDYDETLSRAERSSRDSRDPEMRAAVIKALKRNKPKADQQKFELTTANDLLALANAYGVPEVVAQIRRVMRDDPARMAEVEASVWNRVFADALDPTSTAQSVRKVQRATDGPAFIEGDEGNLLAMYRELAGDEKADAVEMLLKRARAARIDGSSATGSPVGSARLADQFDNLMKAQRGGPQGWIDWAAKRFSINDPESFDAAVYAALENDPRALLELLEAPSLKEFQNWKARWSRSGTRESAREAGKSSAKE